jgi:hypothetical protein
MSSRLRVITLVVCLAAFAVVFAPESRAQAVSGAEVSGFVADPSGSPIAGATVQMTQTEARGEAFNFINHTNFSALSISSLAIVGIPTGLSSSTFGKPQSAGDPRIFQFALKVRF